MRTLCLALLLAGCMAVPSEAPLPTPRASVQPVEPRASGVILDFGVLVLPVPRRPVLSVPAQRVRVERTNGSGRHGGGDGVVAGLASWYCGHGSACTRGYGMGLYAAAGPRLRVGNWRGRYVRVVANGQAVVVRLIDWCQCGAGARLLDLYSDAFQRLAPLDRGLLKVTVSW